MPCQQCQQSVRKSHLEQHTTVECQRRPVSCQDCVATFVFEEKEVMWTCFCNCSCCFFQNISHRRITQLHCESVRISLLTVWFRLLPQLHEQQCPFANVTCQYCEMDLIRDQVGDRMSTMNLASDEWECFSAVNCYLLKLTSVNINFSFVLTMVNRFPPSHTHTTHFTVNEGHHCFFCAKG